MAEIELENVLSESKIPDTIKFLPNFDGNSSSLIHFLETVDNVLILYQNVAVAHPQAYRVWVGVVRGKITGKANEALSMRHVANDWPAIRAALIEIFGDRQDLQTLQQKIPFLKKGNKTLDEFYKEVSELLALMLQKYDLDPRFQVQGRGNQFARIILGDFMRNAFIDGLGSPYNITVRSQNVTTLEQAKAAAETQFQAEERSKIIFGAPQNFLPKKQKPRQISPQNFQQMNTNRRAYQTAQPSNQANQNYFPRTNGNLRGNFNRNNSELPRNNSELPRQFDQRNAQSQPMDVDPSAKTRQTAQPMSMSLRQNHQMFSIEQNPENLEETEEFEEYEPSDQDNELNFRLNLEDSQTG